MTAATTAATAVTTAGKISIYFKEYLL